jgi:hypothetical protein
MDIHTFLDQFNVRRRGVRRPTNPPALLDVMQAIEKYQGCFKYEPTPEAETVLRDLAQ